MTSQLSLGGTVATVVHVRERPVKQGFKLSPYLFILYNESVIREAEIDEIGIKIGGKLVCNLCAESQEEAEIKCEKDQTSENWEDPVLCMSG